MIAFSSGQRYFFYREATDMRKGFDSLSGLVTGKLKRDPLSGDVYVFVNRRRTHVKLLVWDRSGFVLYYKRLEQGTFEIPEPGLLSWSRLVLMLEGVSLKSARYRKRYSKPETSNISS
jgi:hypothetical protein